MTICVWSCTATKQTRRVVVQTLYNACIENEPNESSMSEIDFKKLELERAELNRYVDLLHKEQQPLGLNPFQVLGELARLAQCPALPTGRGDPKNLTIDQLEQAVTLAKRLSDVWSIAIQRGKFPWRGCTSSTYSMELRTQILTLLGSCLKATQALDEDASRTAVLFGLPSPKSTSDLWILEVGRMLQECPGVPAVLLSTNGDLYQNLRSAKLDRWEYARVANDYERGMIELDLPNIIRLWQSRFRWVNPQFYLQRSKLQKLRIHHTPTQDTLKDLKRALQLKEAIVWADQFRSKLPMKITDELLQIAEGGGAECPKPHSTAQLTCRIQQISRIISRILRKRLSENRRQLHWGDAL